MKMLVFILILIAILIIGFCLGLTSKKKKMRITVGIVLIVVSIISYPLLVPVFGEWKALEGVASLMFFNFILLVGGIITLIAGFFTKPFSKGIESLNNDKPQ
jgi:4-amino-4-deoxy-L-arabinose transferase-like glycosyltransferase